MCQGIKINAVQFINGTEKSVCCHTDIIDRRMPLYIMCSVMSRPCFICPSSYVLYSIVRHKLKKYIECWSILNNFETVYKKLYSGELKEFSVQQFKLSYIITCKNFCMQVIFGSENFHGTKHSIFVC